MGKATSGGASIVFAVLALSQRLGNYENKPLAIILAIGACGSLIWFGVQFLRQGLDKLRAAKEANDPKARKKIYGGFSVAAVFMLAIVAALVWRPSKVVEPPPSKVASNTNTESTAPPSSPKEQPSIVLRKNVHKGTGQPKRTSKTEGSVTAPGTNSGSVGTITQGPCSNVQVGGSSNTATTNCGPLPPKIAWHIEPRELRKDLAINETIVILSVDHSLEVPAFVATCDQPCNSDPDNSGPSTRGGVHTLAGGSTAHPFATALTFKLPRPLGPGVDVYWRISALDKNLPVTVLSVEILPPSALPENIKWIAEGR